MTVAPPPGRPRPWAALYTTALADDGPVNGTLLDRFAGAVEKAGDGPAIHYFDRTLSYRDVDRMSDRLAAALVDGGFQPGDRLALYLQNVPQFILASVAAWKAGGIVVPISPMSRETELAKVLPDSTPKVIVAHEDLLPHLEAAIAGVAGYAPQVFTTSPRALQTRDDERVLPAPIAATARPDLMTVIAEHDGRAAGAGPALDPAAPAFLVYTSGTTGPPKGAKISHASVLFSTRSIAAWWDVAAADGPILGLAPLFHITGLVAGMAAAFETGKALVLTYRFDAGVILDALVERRPSFTVGAITGFIALMQSPLATPGHFRSFRAIVSGGAPVPPAVVERFEQAFGRYIHQGYGLTETTAGVTSVPLGLRAPVDPASGALSVGVPCHGIDLWIADEDGAALPPGEVGEIVVGGPGVSAGYWDRPEETAHAMRPDGFHTGDVGFIDAAGWVYLVDRKKDMIVASGFKVWPREVEDVLYAHPAIREAAVVGVPDDYRGQSVRAVVSLKPGASAAPGEIAEWCRNRMAAYKVPKDVVITDELPKSITGKVLRRELTSAEGALSSPEVGRMRP